MLTDIEKGGQPAPVNKYHDYFTSCLPAPQKGDAIKIGILQDTPVYTSNKEHLESKRSIIYQFDEGVLDPTYTTATRMGLLPLGSTNNVGAGIAIQGDTKTNVRTKDVEGKPINLWAKTSNAAAITINELRSAFQLQKMLERDARGGTRYTEIIKSHFGVNSQDSRLQRAEYLGGVKKPITINQVLQTSATNETTPQANESAYSLTGEQRSLFTKAFTEHGYILGFASVRTNHTYSQGIERLFSRKKRTDFYDPVFANIGEQPILKKEIFAQGTREDEEVFGYNEAWADYRYKPNRVSGLFRPEIKENLAF